MPEVKPPIGITPKNTKKLIVLIKRAHEKVINDKKIKSWSRIIKNKYQNNLSLDEKHMIEIFYYIKYYFR